MNSDIFYMQIAIKEAKKAFERNEVPVGAVIVENEEIIAKAFNRIEELNNPFAHAEILAIKSAVNKKKYPRLQNATIYVTLEPCVMCAGALINARIKRIVFGCRDKKAGAILSLFNLREIMKGIHNFTFTQGVLEDICLELIQKFFKNLRENKV